MFQDGGQLQADPAGALAKFRALGANSIRVVVFWYQIAPNPNSKTKPKFNATDPNAYPSANWTVWDTIVRDAAADGIKVDFTVAGGPPVWADGPSIPKAYVQNTHWAWKPNAAAYGQFMQAMGKRYSGTFTPKGQSTRLPRVSMWSLWNEPNFGEDLGPQAINDSTVLTAPMYYRNLANQGYNALKKTGHSRDTILIGELAVEGFEQGRQPKSHRRPARRLRPDASAAVPAHALLRGQQLQAAAPEARPRRSAAPRPPRPAGSSAARTPACSTPAACRSTPTRRTSRR